MNIHSQIKLRFAALSLAFVVLIGGGCSAGKFAGESKMKKRKQQYISAAERPVEITNRHNIWVVTRDNFVKKWDNLTTTNGQTTITVPDVSGIKVNMTIRGPGLEFGGGSRIAAINGNILTLARGGEVRYTASQTTRSGTYNVYTGVAHWLSVEGNTIVQRKKWSGIDGNFNFGFRTYVTEGGVLIARFPLVYFIDPETTPEGLVPDTNIKNFDPSQSYNEHSRMCLASYLKGDKRYMIAAVANGKYYEIELSPSKPHKPLWDSLPNPRETPDWTYEHGWGYSCHMNQKKKIFYSQWYIAGAKAFVTPGDPKTRQGGAVDLNDYSAVDLDAKMPNAKFIQNNSILSTFSRGPQTVGASYAVTGDPDGNIYNGDWNANVTPTEKNHTYTMSYQKMSDTVWVSRHTTPAKIGIIKRKCLTTDGNCGPNDFQFQQGPEAAAIGPLSALKDGRLVGIARKGDKPSAVYLLSLIDPADITKGASFHLLAEIDGDAYMYVDFTGATLYTRQVEQSFKVRDMPEYVKRQRQNDDRAEKTKEALFEWTNAPNTPADWAGLKLEARCYENASSKGDYQEVKSVAKAGEKTTMNIPACKDKYVEFIDVRISQVSGETLGDINKIRVHITQ